MLIKGSLCAKYFLSIVTKISKKLAGLNNKMKRGLVLGNLWSNAEGNFPCYLYRFKE